LVVSAPRSPLAIAEESPEVVGRRDKKAWLQLFTDDATVEDPVGAGAHVGHARLSKFWDVFIAPQRSIRFTPCRDFAHADRAIRYVTISSVTPVSDDPFVIPAIIEYVAKDQRLASLRAFWEPSLAVTWHAKKGLAGIGGLLRHGTRTTLGLGLGKAMGFGLAMRAKVGKDEARAITAELAAALGGSRDAWNALTKDARVNVAPSSGEGPFLTDPRAAFDALAPTDMTIEETILAGDHLACVLSSHDRAAVALVRVARGRPAAIELLFSV
jgi:hypothetical protein